MRRLLLIALFAAAAPFAAGAEETSDPFALETAISDADLAAARGGFSIGGLVFDFALRTRVTIDGALDLSGAASPLAVTFDPAHNTMVINNTLDDVAISRVVSLDVTVPNFTPALSSAQAASAGADFTAMLLSLGSF